MDPHQTETKDESEAKYEPKIGDNAETKTESESVAQDEPKIGVGDDAETEPKAQDEPNTGAGTEPKAQDQHKIGAGDDAETEPKAQEEHKIGAGDDAETEPRAQDERKIEAADDGETEPKPQVEPNTGAGNDAETEPKAQDEPKIGVGDDAATEPKAQDEPKTGAGDDTETEPKAQDEPKTGAGAETEPKAQDEPKTGAGAETKTENQSVVQDEPKTGAGAETKTESESITQDEPKIGTGDDAETELKAQDEPNIGAGDDAETELKAEDEPNIGDGAEAEPENENESDSSQSSETENESEAEQESEAEVGSATGFEVETAEMKVGSIPKRWRILSGETNWKNMLSPPDKDLRRYIIHNGEMAMATYDAFNFEQVSQYTGTCRYSKKEFFSKVGLVKGNPFKYKITKYIYATSNMASVPQAFILKSKVKDSFLKQSNWMGYVAVSTSAGKKALGRRDILVAWRGTLRMAEWMEDFDAALVPAGKLFKGYSGVMVHRGFLSVYTTKNSDTRVAKSSARDQVLSEVRRLMKKYRGEQTSITVAGHSLGAALGTLNAADIVANRVHMLEEEDGSNTWIPVSAFVFACPQTGNRSFRHMVDELSLLRIMRIRNIRDVVPAVPPEGIGYVGVGKELRMDFIESPYLRPPGDVSSWHDLEVYLHLVAGTHGIVRRYKMEVKRDIALVNKYTNALWARYLVPPYWKITANRGMIQQPDGSWKLGYRPYYLEDEVEVEDDLEDEDEVEEEHENESESDQP